MGFLVPVCAYIYQKKGVFQPFLPVFAYIYQYYTILIYFLYGFIMRSACCVGVFVVVFVAYTVYYVGDIFLLVRPVGSSASPQVLQQKSPGTHPGFFLVSQRFCDLFKVFDPMVCHLDLFLNHRHPAGIIVVLFYFGA